MIRALAADEILARRRPKAILFVYLWELFWAMVVVLPIASWARRTWGGHPDGDAPLFAPGGRHLFAWLDLFGDHSAAPLVVKTSLVLVLVGAILSQAPLAVLLVSLATGRGETGAAPRLGEALRASAGSMIALGGVFLIAAFLEGIVVGLGSVAAFAVEKAAAPRWGDGRAIAIAIAVFALFAILWAAIGVLADLARAAIVNEIVFATSGAGERTIADEPASPLALLGRGMRSALRVGFRGLLRAMAAWGSRAAIGLVLLVFGSLASEGLGGRGGLALAGVAIAHQLVVLGRVALRASWLARALRLVG